MNIGVLQSILDSIFRYIKPKGYVPCINKLDNRYLILIIKDNTSFLGTKVKLTERIYCIQNNIFYIKKCIACDKIVNFKSYGKGYNKYCSVKCSANNIISKEKRRQTNIKKYGVENVFQSELLKKK